MLAPYRDRSTLERIADLESPVGVGPVGVDPGLTVVILNLDRPDLIVPLLQLLVAGQEAFEERDLGLQVIVGDTGSTDPEVLACYEDLAGRITVVPGCATTSRPTTTSACPAGQCTTGCCSSTMTCCWTRSNRFLRCATCSMITWSARWGCAWTSRTDGCNAGVDVFRAGELAGLSYHPWAGQQAVHHPGRTWPSVAATGAALMMPTELFAAAGGFDERYRDECQDVDICLAVRRLGYEVMVLDAGPIVHLENATRTRGEENWPDRRMFVRRWGSFIEAVWP